MDNPTLRDAWEEQKKQTMSQMMQRMAQLEQMVAEYEKGGGQQLQGPTAGSSR